MISEYELTGEDLTVLAMIFEAWPFCGLSKEYLSREAGRRIDNLVLCGLLQSDIDGGDLCLTEKGIAGLLEQGRGNQIDESLISETSLNLERKVNDDIKLWIMGGGIEEHGRQEREKAKRGVSK